MNVCGYLGSQLSFNIIDTQSAPLEYINSSIVSSCEGEIDENKV